jgi:tRNA pseudouridine13 synthase
MTKQATTGLSQADNGKSALDGMDWAAELATLSYAFERPIVSGNLKVVPEDFIVTELMDVEPTGEGEHTWLDITKTRCNTDAVAKALARFAGVAYRDVAYSGMKDFHAVTRQWFSVWRPKGESLNWSEFALDGVDVHSVVKHSRKIKRGTHRANAFSIRATSLAMSASERPISKLENADVENELEHRLLLIQKAGVPNYFGEQRFGRNANNMRQALDMLTNGRRVKDRNLRGLLLSSARSWLFNQCVSARILNDTWQQLYENEPANLNGSNSVFTSDNSLEEKVRLAGLDIHPTAPMWGDGVNKVMRNCIELENFETLSLSPYKAIMTGLVNARVDYQRRPIRSIPANLHWQFERSESGVINGIVVHFELQSGQFATSVMRELLCEAIAGKS